MKRSTLPPSMPSPGSPPRPRNTDRRCPATYRHTPLYSVYSVGVQCKYAAGHDGDHAGRADFENGDVFWPQDKPVVVLELGDVTGS